MYTMSQQEDEEDEAGEVRGDQKQRVEATAPMDVVEDDENRSVVSEVKCFTLILLEVEMESIYTMRCIIRFIKTACFRQAEGLNKNIPVPAFFFSLVYAGRELVRSLHATRTKSKRSMHLVRY